MITIKTFLSDGLKRLQTRYEAGEARAVLYQLLMESLGMSHTELLLLDKDTALSSEQRLCLEGWLMRLELGEPLQYILGYAYFFDLRLYVAPGVLIPRPETEELVYLMKQELSRRQSAQALRVLDVGTGSACIPLGLATQLGPLQLASIDAIDISPEALAIAHSNVERLRPEVAIRLIEADVFTLDAPMIAGGYDIIVSNPPYIHPDEAKTMSSGVLDWEPSGALFAPEDSPTLYYDAIAQLVCDGWLRPGGMVWLEINPLYAELTLSRMQAIIGADKLAEARLLHDLSGKERFIYLSTSIH